MGNVNCTAHMDVVKRADRRYTVYRGVARWAPRRMWCARLPHVDAATWQPASTSETVGYSVVSGSLHGLHCARDGADPATGSASRRHIEETSAHDHRPTAQRGRPRGTTAP